MKTRHECLPCIERQIGKLAERITDDRNLRLRIVRDAVNSVSAEDMQKSPPYVGRKVQRAVRKASGNSDPYFELKQNATNQALDLRDDLAGTIDDSPDSFVTAVRAAIAGNIIDFGPADDFQIMETAQRMLRTPPVVDDVESFRKAATVAETILYLGDNAGETVFDKLLIERLPGSPRVTFAVRGGPVLNDATVDDAEAAGLREVAEIVSNGSDAPGTIPEDCSDEFRRVFGDADLIVAKGMGNFESLCHIEDRPILFLLIAKCPVVAGHLRCEVGDAVVFANAAFKKRAGV